ncbi:MAG TPA: sterol desaturase family protein [Kofleriaceae bacterium]|jgi:sterol desaturase/sphingolipid hydroxylase (fatty acid hydroxylase superfamily)|nr:sterol desaturase family protein [Kofleriaceae bacterium]
MSWLVLASIPAFLISIGIELVWARAHRTDENVAGYEAKDTWASLAMGLGNVGISALTKIVTIAALTALYEYRAFDLAEKWWAWVVLLFAEDLCYYAFHRASHEVRFLWAAHVNHHSSRKYNLSTALRQSWTTPITGPIFWMPLALVGFTPAMVMTAQAWSLLYQFWLHTESVRTLGPLEAIMNTPSHHRVHHGSNVEYLDRNHAGIFIIWDRLFGTFEPERAKVEYGLTTNIETYNPLKIASHEWIAIARDVRRARRVRDKLGYIFMPPGWSPDGSTRTARELQALARSGPIISA